MHIDLRINPRSSVIIVSILATPIPRLDLLYRHSFLGDTLGHTAETRSHTFVLLF